MASEPLSVPAQTPSSLAGLLNVASSQTVDTVGASDFLALLNGSGNSVDHNTSNTHKPATSGNKVEKKQDPLAAAIDVPTAIIDNLPNYTAAPTAPVNKNAPANAFDNNQQTRNQANAQQQASNDNSQPVSKPASASTADANSATTDANQAEQQLRAQLQKQLGNISDILAGIFQLLQAGNAATPSTSAVTSGGSGGAANLISDMQAILQQLQQQLQGTGGQAGSLLQTQGAPDLQTLAASLAKDMANLAQLLQQQKSTSDDAASAALAAATPSAAVDSLTNLKTQLKDSISQVRDQLQKLSGVNDSIFAQAKANFQAQLASVSPTSASTKDAAPAAGAAANTNTVVPLVQDVPINPVMTATPVAVAVTAGLDISQGGANNSGSNSGQDQGTPMPTITPLSAGQAQATTAAVSTPFAKMIAQASQSTVLEQVTFNVKTALGDGSSKIHIQLDPAELGKLDIKLTVDSNGKTGVVITADNKNTLDLLQKDTQGLTRALNDAGLTTDNNSLSFNMRDGQQGQGQANPQALSTYQKAQPDEEEDVTVNAITRSYVVNLAEGLDIKI